MEKGTMNPKRYTAYMLTFLLALLLLSSSFISCGSDEQPLSGTWMGTYTDTSLAVSVLTLGALSGKEITDKDIMAATDLLSVYEVELHLEQMDDISVVGNVRVGNREASIRNGTFIGNTLTFSYTEEHFLSGSEELNISAKLTGMNKLEGDWGSRGFWEVIKQ